MEQNEFEIEAKRMRPALLRMAIRYLEDSDEAEDAVQDVLLKLWFLRDRLDQYRSVDALAIVITKHLCINRLRGTRIEKVDLEQGISIGGGENPEMNQFLYNEAKRILSEYGNHPSFCFLSLGNELQPDFEFLGGLLDSVKALDSRHLYTTTSFTFEKGHGDWPEPHDDFFITQWTKKLGARTRSF